MDENLGLWLVHVGCWAFTHSHVDMSCARDILCLYPNSPTTLRAMALKLAQSLQALVVASTAQKFDPNAVVLNRTSSAMTSDCQSTTSSDRASQVKQSAKEASAKSSELERLEFVTSLHPADRSWRSK